MIIPSNAHDSQSDLIIFIQLNQMIHLNIDEDRRVGVRTVDEQLVAATFTFATFSLRFEWSTLVMM